MCQKQAKKRQNCQIKSEKCQQCHTKVKNVKIEKLKLKYLANVGKKKSFLKKT